MKIFFLTATGNGLYVAKRIGGELYSIPQMLKEGKSEFEDEAIGFVFPCYGLGLPRMVIDFLQKSKFKAKYFFAIMTYGNMAAAGLKQMEKVGSKAGIQFDYINEILMIDNFLPAFKMEDQVKKESSKKIEEKLDEIVSDIKGRQKKLTRKGITSVILSKFMYSIFSKMQVDAGDKWFIVQDNCNGCKVCMKVCPKKNIKVGIKAEFLHKCDGCYACIHHCPQNAIHLKFEKSKDRFINRHVKLKEIIDVNNQCNP
ncbi:EFR1 family ferrodoxin [Pelosinus baikalensis]|uniref:4Fe-4S dicluster domain-containing protein n=1 Tax=Pelosinus baikalensis TaxID=2892015 RepID=A0ABS8I1C2_9FIRM|nr:EFR1 family ferrodoxin [Pelosinus baikalensis]MCC5468294.1 4Fe-4S dicluster domain-containing protein [Pelosinus baikalensis]